VDIDPHELEKFPELGMKTETLIQADAGLFLEVLLENADVYEKRDISDWLERVSSWKREFPICPRDYYDEEMLNPYVFVKALSRTSREGDVFFVDTGCSIAWMMQAFEFKKSQRLFHDFNNTAMGYALPASIGASLGMGRRQVVCVTGDGSLQMNLQELATVIRHQLPIKIFLVNNRGYTMIQQTQDQWLNSEYEASTVQGGLAFPDFVKVARAYGYKTFTITRNRGLTKRIREILQMEGPVFCNLEFADYHRVAPQVKYGRAMEDGEPLLERSEFLRNMIVAPDPASL
jgi:acetolactate synthase I/II/III large subunit